MKLLVTGGLGFIGSNFIRYVLSRHREVEVVNLDKMGIGSNPKNLEDLEGDERYRFVKGDLLDFDLVSRLVREVDAVVNFAAETHVDRSIANPRAFLESNTVGTFNLLEAARLNNPRLRIVHVSTDEVYSDILVGSYKEEDRLKPSSPYAASKAAADMFCLAYHRTYGLDVVVTRCTNNFGPYQFPEKLIPKTIIRASLGMKVPIYGTGRNVRDWIYVLDHCEALDLVLERGRPGDIQHLVGGRTGQPHARQEDLEDNGQGREPHRVRRGQARPRRPLQPGLLEDKEGARVEAEALARGGPQGDRGVVLEERVVVEAAGRREGAPPDPLEAEVVT